MNREITPEVSPLVTQIRPLWKAAKERVGSAGKFMDTVADFAQELKRKYPDALHRRAYHALIGSTMKDDEPGIIEEDFPGEDSVVRFLESLANEV